MTRKIGVNHPRKSTTSNSWEDYLDAGEKLIWQGAPATGLRFSVSGLGLSVTGLFFLGFSSVWLTMGGSGSKAWVFPLIGLPFVLTGLWLVAGHWFFDAYKRKHARYALTNKRALIARTLFGRRMESYSIDGRSPIHLVSGKLDTVHFAQKTYHTKNGPQVRKIGFRFIPDGQEVYDLLRSVKEENK